MSGSDSESKAGDKSLSSSLEVMRDAGEREGKGSSQLEM